MFSAAFENAYRRLVRAFKRHQDAPRSSDDVAVIGDARWELHLARNAMAEERRAVLSARPAASAVTRKFDVSDDELVRLRVEAVSAGFG
jgi:hypothetical protein